jgi:putative ABC transport system permease protein
MDMLYRDVTHVVRALRRSPGFAATAVLTLALGIACTTAVFSVVRGVLLRALPYPEPHRIVHLWQVNARGPERMPQAQVSEPNFDDWRAQTARGFRGMALVRRGPPSTVTANGDPIRAFVTTVSGEFFSVMGVRPILGRAFLPEELREGAGPAAIVSDAFWRRNLGGDVRALERAVLIGQVPHTVVGVMPPEFDYPPNTEVWRPRELAPPNPSRTAHGWQVVARLADGISLEQARRDLSAASRRLHEEHGSATMMVDASIVPLREHLVGRVQSPLVILLGASAFLLLIACASVLNLLVARATERRHEVALRLALGAARAHLTRQLLVESLALSLAGAALGAGLATVGVRLLLAMEPGRLPRLGEVGIDAAVLGFALGISMLTAVGLGLLTAARTTDGDIPDALARSSRAAIGGKGSDRTRSFLVVTQIALSVVLLAGAGLLGRSVLLLTSVDPGFRTERAVILDVSVPWPADALLAAAGARVSDRHAALLERLATLPGVSHVGAVNQFPLGSSTYSEGPFIVLGSRDDRVATADLTPLAQDPARSGTADFRVASAGYFGAVGIPLVRGRLFEDRDGPSAPHVAVISETLARTRWPAGDAIGKIIQYGTVDGNLTPLTIVGIVGDVRERGLDAAARPMFYAHYRQRTRQIGVMSYVLRGSGDPAAIASAAQQAVRATAPDLPPRVRRIETLVAESIADRRFTLVLLGVFGTAALGLAMMGIYGVTSYLVSQRRAEIGVRVALGAQRIDVLRLVVGHGAVLTATGIAVGIAAALGITRLLGRLLYGVGAADPVSFGAAVAALALVALLATALPAWRAARLDPVEALRNR